MKILLSQLVLLAILSGCSTITRFAPKKPSGTILSYGILKDLELTSISPLENSPSGVIRSYDGIEIATITDRIPIRDGLRFGIVRKFSGIPDGEETIEIVVSHPPITNGEGEIFTRQRYFTATDSMGSSYGFDHAYEKVEGEWTFECLYNGTLLCKKTFFAYIE